jgi:6-phosphofructokinase 2
MPADAYVHLVRQASQHGVRVALDTSGKALAHALREKVFLVKPSLRELSELVGRPLADETAWRAAARQIVDDGLAQVVALTLGEQGALVVTRTQTLRAQALPVPVSSAIGAGDSFVAAMIWAINRNESFDDAFRYALAAASATLLAEGTALCKVEDVMRLYQTLTLAS